MDFPSSSAWILPWSLAAFPDSPDGKDALSDSPAPEAARPAEPGPLESEVISLYDEHANTLYRFAMATLGGDTESQDAVQDCFLSYFAYRLAGNQVEDPRIWLLRSIRNGLGRAEEQGQLRGEAERASAALTDLPFPRPDDGVHRADLKRVLPGLLSPRELEVMQLRAEGMQYGEIAEVMGITSGAVGAFIARAMRKLYANRHLLEDRSK